MIRRIFAPAWKQLADWQLELLARFAGLILIHRAAALHLSDQEGEFQLGVPKCFLKSISDSLTASSFLL